MQSIGNSFIDDTEQDFFDSDEELKNELESLDQSFRSTSTQNAKKRQQKSQDISQSTHQSTVRQPLHSRKNSDQQRNNIFLNQEEDFLINQISQSSKKPDKNLKSKDHPQNSSFISINTSASNYQDENCPPTMSKNSSFTISSNHRKSNQKKTNPKSFKKATIQKDIKALVIGATGAGKTSLINLFYTWSKGWGPQEIAQGVSVLIKTEHLEGDGETESNVTRQNESQTNKAKHYCFELENPQTGIRYILNFLDTPGIGDTSGIEKDEKHFDLIMDTVRKTSGLNAILLVMNGADGRINARVRYIMVKLQGMVPDALRDNLLVLLTNVDLVPNLDINQVLDFKINPDKVFYYNNQIFKLKPSHFNNHNVKRKLDQSYKDSLETLSSLLDAISQCSVKPTKEFEVIKESRDKLKKKLVECNDTDAKINKKKQELQRLASDIASGQVKVSDLQKQLNQTVVEEDFQSQPTPYHNTTCLTCKNCCHERCGLNETTQQGSSIFMGCWAFGGNSQTCQQCQHSYTSHVHLRVKYVKTTKNVSKVNPNVQQAISQAQNEAAAQTQARNAIDAELKKLDQELLQNHLEIKNIIKTMQTVCSRFDYMKEIEACINVLDEQIDAATSDFSLSLNQADANTLDGLQKTKARMEKLKKDLVSHLKK